MPVRIQDVALAAGVSVSTVSRVLNGRNDVAADTLSARPERLSTTWAIRRAWPPRACAAIAPMSIGVIIFDLSNPFSIEVLRGIDPAGADPGL